MKWYLNGFPKSGLHLLDALVRPITQPGRADVAGTYTNGSWAYDRVPLSLIMDKLSAMPDHHRMMGHSCYDETLDAWLADAGIAHVFIYRDLRDVAVSQTYHILSDDLDRFPHPGKDYYRAMGGFEDVLAAVWNGTPEYPGVEDRWKRYRGWLESGHTLCLRFGQIIASLPIAAMRIYTYLMDLHEAKYHSKLGMIGDVTINRMASSAADTGNSRTFRRGVPGEWKQYRNVFEREYEQA